jgi:hypothetical protein
MLVVVCLVGTLSAFAHAEQMLGIPTGAVMAFHLPECPEGWKRFDAANGRTIIALGQRSPDATDYGLGQQFPLMT